MRVLIIATMLLTSCALVPSFGQERSPVPNQPQVTPVQPERSPQQSEQSLERDRKSAEDVQVGRDWRAQQRDQQDKTTGQAPSSGASSFYLAQDPATMKCKVITAQPAPGDMKVIGTAHRTQEEAQTALIAEKTCVK
jgi:hypothetical protein